MKGVNVFHVRLDSIGMTMGFANRSIPTVTPMIHQQEPVLAVIQVLQSLKTHVCPRQLFHLCMTHFAINSRAQGVWNVHLGTISTKIESALRLTRIAVNLMKIMVIVHPAIKVFKSKTINAFLQNNKKMIPTVTSSTMDFVSNVPLVSILIKSTFAPKFQMIVPILMNSLEFVMDATLAML